MRKPDKSIADGRRQVHQPVGLTEVLRELEAEMADAADKFEYERAALLRDQTRELKKQAGIRGLMYPLRASGCR